jgi:hypothetical protein
MPLPCHASVVSHHLNPRYACAHPTISEALLEEGKQAGAGEEARIGRKLPGTSARFASGGLLFGVNQASVRMRRTKRITFQASSRIIDR